MTQQANPIGNLSSVKEWEYKILDPNQLPDVAAIEKTEIDAQMARNGKYRLIAAGVGLIPGIVMLIIGKPLIIALLVMVIGPLLAAVIAHFVIRSMGAKEAQRKVMPDIAKMCGGNWAEDSSSIIPGDNPLAAKIGYSNQFNNGNDYNNQFDNNGSGGLSLDNSNNGFNHRGQLGTWLEYGDGIAGLIPRYNLPYGVANVTIVTRTERTDAEGNPQPHTERDRYVISWIDLQMPINSMEIKRRWMKGGGMFGRMFDKLDSKFTSQQVVELESEQFNQMFKLELADNADAVLVRRMFSPKMLDAFTTQKIPLYDDICYRNHRVWVLDGKVHQFDAHTAAKTLDYMIYRAQMIAHTCQLLAQEVGQSIERSN